MIDVIETNEKIILVCNYKTEKYILADIIAAEFPELKYKPSKYREKPAIFLNKDVLPEKYRNYKTMQSLIDKNISRAS
ncbi:unknown [Clostridium sp. CAG:470]|nr:MAG: hypothetical protein BHW03_02270 [Clostridium sp. 28_17]CDE14796.1 unknown [Clostridium sp. CAG:470]